MKAERTHKTYEFISAKRKALEEEFRRVFEREDFNIDRLTSHAEQVACVSFQIKYLQDKFAGKERQISELQDKLQLLRGSAFVRQRTMSDSSESIRRY